MDHHVHSRLVGRNKAQQLQFTRSWCSLSGMVEDSGSRITLPSWLHYLPRTSCIRFHPR